MSLTPAAKRRIDDAAAEVIGAQKDAYREKIVAIQAAFRPKLTNAELAAGLGLKAPAPGATGQSDIGRFVSTSPRNRRARPDAWARTLIDALLAGTLLIAVREEGELDARREIVVCEPADVSWLGAGWSVKNLAGGEVPETRSAAANWDAETMWDLFDETPAAAEQPPSVSVADADVGPVQLASLALSAIGLGGMRLSTAGRPDEALGIRLLHQAWGMGLTFVDTADAYCQDDTDVGHNERLIAKALASWSGPREQIVIATKGGLIRPGGRWIPSGHPTHLRAAAEASAKALGVDAIPLYQLHAVDSKVPFSESVGALMDLQREGLIQHIGLSNVKRDALDEARALGPIVSVQNRGNVFDVADFKSELVAHCDAHGIRYIAYSPVGGHRKRDRCHKHATLVTMAGELGLTPEEVALGWLLRFSPTIIPIPGATRLETVDSIAKMLRARIPEEAWRALDAKQPWSAPLRARLTPASRDEVVMLMGSPAAGKTSLVSEYERAGYERLNRDMTGGNLKRLLPMMRQHVAEGRRRFVMDNTYGSLKSRADVIAEAQAHALPVRCVHLDTPRAEAKFNASLRMVRRHGKLLSPDEMKVAAKRDPNMFPPVVLSNYFKHFVKPEREEGFASIETLPFVRNMGPEYTGKAIFLDYDGTLRESTGEKPFPCHPKEVQLLPGRREKLLALQAEGYLLLGISNQGGVAMGSLTEQDARACFDRTNELLGIAIDVLFCPHTPKGLRCWCRKPNPGMGVLFIERYKLDRASCTMVGDMKSDATFAANLGVAYEDASDFFGPT